MSPLRGFWNGSGVEFFCHFTWQECLWWHYGGTVKRLVTKASLQRPYDDQIVTLDALMEFCVQNIPGIKLFNVTPEEIANAASQLKDRFERAKTVKGTQQYHRFVPISSTMLHVYKLHVSAQEASPDAVHIVDRHDAHAHDEQEQHAQLELKEIREQCFVCCIYDGLPWVGMVDEISKEFGDYHIKVMHPRGQSKQFKWPAQEDQCWITEDDILCQIDTPSLTSSSSRHYRGLAASAMRKIKR